MAGEDLLDVTAEWGGTAAVLMVATLEPPIDRGTLKMPSSRIRTTDVRASKYLAGRYENDFPAPLKILLLMIEGDLNTNRLYLPTVAVGHEHAAFRARVVTLYHSLTALQKVMQRYQPLSTAAMREIQELLEEDDVRGLLGPGGRGVRNRCIHYDIKDRSIALDPSRPLHGIVEAVDGRTYERFDAVVRGTTERLAEILGRWQPAAA
jgi:hypothetical protein